MIQEQIDQLLPRITAKPTPEDRATFNHFMGQHTVEEVKTLLDYIDADNARIIEATSVGVDYDKEQKVHTVKTVPIVPPFKQILSKEPVRVFTSRFAAFCHMHKLATTPVDSTEKEPALV